jgi:hypothetical protein
MSSYVDKEYFYYLRGRELLLYKLLGGSSNERISQSGVLRTRGKELMYPNEDIADGLRVEYTALNEPFIAEAFESVTGYASGTGISFDPGPAATISDSNDGFADTGKAFAQGDKIRVQGSASNDGDYTLTSSGTVDENTLTITGTFTTEAVGERVTITQIPLEATSPDATSHINLNKMLSLSVVDYLKAMSFESAGDIERKEYYMKEFYGKLGDNESNKRNISITFPTQPFAIR